jgi:hypothetical protein
VTSTEIAGRSEVKAKTGICFENLRECCRAERVVQSVRSDVVVEIVEGESFPETGGLLYSKKARGIPR